jgi:hypothetical protein
LWTVVIYFKRKKLIDVEFFSIKYQILNNLENKIMTGNTSHKNTSNKPNVNAEGQLRSDLDESKFSPEEPTPIGDEKREDSTKKIAIERPQAPPEEPTEEA